MESEAEMISDSTLEIRAEETGIPICSHNFEAMYQSLTNGLVFVSWNGRHYAYPPDKSWRQVVLIAKAKFFFK